MDGIEFGSILPPVWETEEEVVGRAAKAAGLVPEGGMYGWFAGMGNWEVPPKPGEGIGWCWLRN